MTTSFLQEISDASQTELDAYLETMAIMMTCDGSHDERELEQFLRIGADLLHSYHAPGSVDLKAKWQAFAERLKTESVGRRLDSIAAVLQSRAKRMTALFFAMKLSTADLRLVLSEREMLHKMQGHFKLTDDDYTEVTAAYRDSVRPR
jgi:hypothetical protein